MTITPLTVRVVHILGTLDRGGAESVALDLCRTVPAAEFQQVFLTLGPHEGRLAPQFAAAGALVGRCPLRPAATFLPRLWWRLRRLQPDVVVSHVSLVSGLILAVAWVTGVSVRIARMHSEGDGRPDTLRRRVQRALLRALLRRSATDVVGVTGAALAFALPRPGDDRYEVLPNGVDIERFAALRASQADAGNAPVFAHVGRAAPEKNRGFLLPVHAEAKRLRVGTRLVVVGPGGFADLESVDPDVMTDRSVDLVGETDHVEEFLAGADVLLLPSHREGLPGVVLEALAAGVPVLATDLPGLREVARQVRGLTLLPLSAGPHAWARSGLTLADTSMRERQDIGETVRESVFTLENSAIRWRSLWARRR